MSIWWGALSQLRPFPTGATLSEYDRRITLLSYKNSPKFYQQRVRFTKVLHTVSGNKQIIKRHTYVDDTYIDSATLEGQQLLWAERTVDRILDFVKVDAQGDMTDGRHRTLASIVNRHSTNLRPALLWDHLSTLLNSSSINENENFMRHRGTVSHMFGTVFNPGRKPKSAVFVQSLLDAFPHRQSRA
jgi:hypothetical protein